MNNIFTKINKFKIEETDLALDVKRVFSFMRKSKVKMKFLVLSVIFSVGLTLFSMYTVSLLFPLSQGIIKGNFSAVKNQPIVGDIIKSFPDFFNDSSTKIFILLVFWTYLTVIIKNILEYGAVLSTQYQAKISTIRLRELLLERFLSFGKRFYDTNTVAFLHGVLTNSARAIETQFNLFQKLITQVLLLLVYLAIMIHISWKLTIISVVIFPIVSVLTKNITRKVKQMSLEHSVISADLNNKVFSLLYCMPLVKGYAKEEKEKAIFSKESAEEIDSSFKMQRIIGLAAPIQDIATTTGVLFVAIGMAWILSFDHSIDASGAIIFFYLAMKMMPGLDALNNFNLGMAGATAQVKQIEHVLEDSDLFVIKDGNREFDGLKKSIEIKNLNFSYTGDISKPILKNINFTIEKGKITAIVGPTGSGKSTIANLLLRFYDCPSGSIYVDGKDIREYNLKSFMKHVSFVSQENFLFNDTIKYNICYSHDGEVKEEKFNEIIRKTLVDNFVENLPNKYNTVVGDRGVRLSGGEKQRIAMARALIKDSEILVMDEATSALDPITEAKISEVISEFAKGKTVIMIAHKLSTIRKADKIIYLDHGQVVELGTLQELIDKKGEFFKQWKS